MLVAIYLVEKVTGYGMSIAVSGESANPRFS